MAPFQLIKFIESNREFGQVYYGHQIPESVELIREIPSQETKGIVYKNEEEGKIIAEEYLKKFKIQLNHIEYKGIDNEYRDEYLHLVYTPKNLEKDIFIK